MQKFRILYLDFSMPHLLADSDFPIGGTAVEWLKWVNSFVELGSDVGILTFEGANKLVNKKYKFELIETFSLTKGRTKLRFFYYRLPKILFAIKKYKPDFIIQAGSNRYAALLYLANKYLKVPTVFRVVSDMDVDGKFKNHFPEYFSNKIIKFIAEADMISCQNEYQKNICEKNYTNKLVKIHYNPFEFIDDKKANLKGDYFAWIGNFSYEKNLPALAKLCEECKEYKFKIAGKGFENNHPEAQKGIDKLKKLHNVEFVGYLKNEDILDFLHKSIALVNTSLLEGFSNTFLEAWSVGKPIITTQNVNPDNIVSKYKLGLVANNYDELPKMIKTITNYDIQTLNKYSNRCKDYVKSNHDAILLARLFLKDINTILKKGNN